MANVTSTGIKLERAKKCNKTAWKCFVREQIKRAKAPRNYIKYINKAKLED